MPKFRMPKFRMTNELLEGFEALQADPNQANHGYYKRIITKAEGKK